MPNWGTYWGLRWGLWPQPPATPITPPPLCTPTNTGALKADFREQIKGITPSYTEYQSRPWVYAPNKRSVSGGELRTFHLQFLPGQSTRTGIQSPEGGEFEAPLRVWTSYAGLGEDDDDTIVTMDGVDLWETLRYRYTLVDGLINVEYEGFEEDGEDEAGRRFGYHSFTIRYLQST